jgi:hypothetical protein
LATFRRRSLNWCMIASKTSRPSRPDSTKTVSGNPEAVHPPSCVFYPFVIFAAPFFLIRLLMQVKTAVGTFNIVNGLNTPIGRRLSNSSYTVTRCPLPARVCRSISAMHRTLT